jgi:hypothetical protein
VVAKVRERLSVCKLVVQKFYVMRFNPIRLNDMEVREQCQVKISDMSVALKN